MPPGYQPFAVLCEVIDLAVENDLQTAVFVGQRLAAFRAEIDDGKPAMAEANTGANIVALIVGTAVVERLAHAN